MREEGDLQVRTHMESMMRVESANPGLAEEVRPDLACFDAADLGSLVPRPQSAREVEQVAAGWLLFKTIAWEVR